jgi:DNA-binding transcriptional regulator of glucitol operon
MPWVDLAGSLQWKSFLRTVDLLQQRGNTVMVLVGPFNEHLLKDASREKYRALKREIEGVLKDKGIPFLAPDPLPSEFYGDASHPLSAGYALLAKQLVAEGFLAAGESPHDR